MHIPASHATQAVLADPDDELAWDAFVDAVRSYCPPDLFDDVRGWADDPERPTTLVDRAPPSGLCPTITRAATLDDEMPL